MSEKKLYRTTGENKKIAGVCGGLAEYFDIDSVLVRLIMVVMGLWGGGVLFYIIAWIVMPEKPAGDNTVHTEAG